ncbi:hypothetical protein EV702DRAFT_1264461, partial [Suillus placidus]
MYSIAQSYTYTVTRRIYEAVPEGVKHPDLGTPVHITSKTELVVEDIDGNTYCYYFVEQDTWCIFWLEYFDAESLFENIRRVRNMGHIIQNTPLKLSTTSRVHCELFLHENRVTPVVLEELKQMSMHAAAVTSVALFGKDELEKMLNLVMNIK